MQSHKPKRSLPVPPMSIHQERLPGLYEEEYEDPAENFNPKTDYSRTEVRRQEYQSSHIRADRYLSADNTAMYDSLGSQRNLASMSYRDPHSPRSMRNEPVHQESHPRSSSRSLERDVSHRSPSRDQQLTHRSPSRILDDQRYRSPSRIDVHRVSLSREPSPAWQRSSLPARTRPRSPTLSLHSWQRSSLPPNSRNRVSEASLHGSSSSLHPPDTLSSSRYSKMAELLESKRPPLLTSKSESYSQSFKKRQADSRLLNFRGYGSAKYSKDQDNKDPNAPFEIHFKHRRNSSLDTARSMENSMKRSSTTYQDFMSTASLEEEARAQKRAEEEEDEAYRILKEGLNIAKSRVVYKFDRTSSQDRSQNVSSSSQDPHSASRSRPSRRSDEYGLDDFRYRPATAVHPDMYESRGELDRISHYSSRSNPLENHSSSYLYHSRPYTTHDSYNYSPLSYNHTMNNHHHHIGSNVTQTSTQTDETSLSAPYTSYTTIPNHYRWPDDSRNKPQQRRFFNFNCNFFKNRNMNKKSSDSKFIYMKSPTPPHCTQVLATLAVAIGPLCAGLGKGYSSPALASMAALSAQGHHFSISKDQGSWVASLSLLGAFFGSLPAGMSIRYGRKRVLCVVAVPFALSWVLTVVAINVYMLYVASFFGGVCTAIIAVVTPVYISEIAHPDIRGCLCALSKLSSNIGMLLSYLLGAFLNWRQLATVTAIAPACLFIAALLIPETPSYLLYRGRDAEASASLSWLRSGRDVARELTTMKANIATLRRHEVLEPPSVAFRDLLRPLFVTCGLMVFQKFSGANAFNFYAVPILSETFVGLDPYRAAVVVAFVQICAGMASSALVDTVGRRPLLVFSNMLMSAALAAFGGYVYLKGLDTNENMFARQQWRQSDWVPLFCILVIEIAFALGVSPISWLYIGELFPLKHRGFGALAASVSYACSFASVKSFVDLDQTLGLYGTFWLYSSLSALALVFTLLFVPETKGLSLQEMQESHKGVFI